MKQRPMNSEERMYAVMPKVVAGAAFDSAKHLGRVLGEEKCARSEQIGDELMQMHLDCLTATGVTVQRCGEGIEGPIKFAGFVKIGIEDIKGPEEFKKLEEYVR